jgi:tetratricopeptide (TPR) repeat protein
VPTVSLTAIARDEEADLPRCLASVRGVVTEMVVVDTGSTDRTVAIAEAAGARVVLAAWENDFSAARNRALAEATGDWALVLDADEELASPGEDKARIDAALTDPLTMGYQLRVRNLSPPGEMVAYTDVWLTRLFRRRDDVRYESRIHEQVSPSILRAGGTVARLDVTVLHHGYARKVAQGQSRAVRNTKALRALVLERPTDAYACYQLGCALQAAGAAAEAEETLRRARTLDRGALPPDVKSGLLLRLSQLALQRREDRDAASLAAEALALDPASTVALQVLAVASVGAGDIVAGHAAFVRLRARPDLRPAFAGEVDRMIAALAPLATAAAPR